MAIHLAILHVRAQTRHVSDRLQALAICESLPWAVCLNFRHLAHAIERFAIFCIVFRHLHSDLVGWANQSPRETPSPKFQRRFHRGSEKRGCDPVIADNPQCWRGWSQGNTMVTGAHGCYAGCQTPLVRQDSCVRWTLGTHLRLPGAICRRHHRA